jgi:signal transduction histidine kinase
MKHSDATEAIIQFNRENERLVIIVEDNGKGFNAKDTSEGIHAGIDTIKSRIDYLNGRLNIDSQKGVGTTVLMEFLIDEKEPASVNI